MIFLGLFFIASSIVLGIILINFLRVTEAERPSFISSTPKLVFLAGFDLLLFFFGLILLLGPMFS
jgi:hypothetical protein